MSAFASSFSSPLASDALTGPGSFQHIRTSADLASAQESFQSVIGRADERIGDDPEVAARKAAEQFVSIALVQPILAEVRASNDAAEPFKPTPAEQQFGSLMDAQTAQEIVRASGFPLVERLARDLLALQQGQERLEAAAQSRITGMEHDHG